MIKYKDYVAGWLDSSIHDFLEVFPPSFTSMDYALITCLDSNPNLDSLLSYSPELAALAGEGQPLEKGLLVPTKLLLEVQSRNKLFFGFDELWFFPSKNIAPKPASVWLVGPDRIDQAKLDRLGPWMSRNSCSLALGDGEGLNVIVKARGLIKHLLGHSIDQPPPCATFVASASAK
jgi:hypothetical protein